MESRSALLERRLGNPSGISEVRRGSSDCERQRDQLSKFRKTGMLGCRFPVGLTVSDRGAAARRLAALEWRERCAR